MFRSDKEYSTIQNRKENNKEVNPEIPQTKEGQSVNRKLKTNKIKPEIPQRREKGE